MPALRQRSWKAKALLALLLTTGLGTLLVRAPRVLAQPAPASPPALEQAPPPRPVEPLLPPWLPHYDMDIRLDLEKHKVFVHQRTTWVNRHQLPANELVFNAHSHYKAPSSEIGLLAKTIEIMRMIPSECIYDEIPFELKKATLGDLELATGYRKDNDTALVVTLPRPVLQGESVTVDLDYVMNLPNKQGRWGYWEGVTFLSNWLPVLAFYDDHGWQPTPFIPWHQPFFNEAGIYTVRVTLPADQKVACSGSIVAERPLPDPPPQGGGEPDSSPPPDAREGRVGGARLKQVDIVAPGVRDFALLSSARYQEFTTQVGPVKVRCLAFPEHEFYAREVLKTASEAMPKYMDWFGPYPWPEMTYAESFFGWNGNECATLVMIDARVFGMPHFATGYVEYLIAHETCHQWWYNMLGTNGYHETWMDEAFANYFAHRHLNQKCGKNNDLMSYPPGLEWLPNIRRENYRYYGLYGTLGRGEATPVVQDMEKFENVITLFSMCYDKGGKILGMIEDQLGEAAFIDFLHVVYKRYRFQIIRVADFQRELEEYTHRSWEDFFQNWLYGTGLTDWSVEKVEVEPVADAGDHTGWRPSSFLAGLHAGEEANRPHRVTVLLHQKAAYNEQTVLGFCLDGGTGYQVRVPILPQVHELRLDEPAATVTTLPDNRVRVEVLLPCRPTQITVDPDQVLVDPDPSNNYWKPPVRWRWTPLYTFLEESSLTCDYDRWNVVAGPWVYGQAYQEPWYTRSPMAGFRVGAYRTEHFAGGVYAAYRSDFNDVVAGTDGLWDHWPFPTTQVGFNVEHRIAELGNEQPNVTRAVLFGRYVFLYGDSLYLPPMHFLEVFGDYQDNFLPFERTPLRGAVRFDNQATAGIHYYINFLTPYWDPEGGFQAEATYAGGVVDANGHTGSHQLTGYVTYIQSMPDLDGWLAAYPGLAPWLGPPLRWLSATRWALRGYGAGGLPDQVEYFALGDQDRFRGFDLRERQGSVIWGANVEWRVPLARRLTWDVCDHVVGARNVYAALFYDVGDAYVNNHSFGPVAHALGVGLRVDLAYLGVVERSTLRFDVAKAIHVDSPVQFWFGFTLPF